MNSKDQTDNVIWAEIVKHQTEKDVYILMLKYGADYWSPHASYDSQEELQKNITNALSGTCTGYSILKATLPIDVHEGEI